MQLLIAQLKNQDPMKPMEDKEFITQLAQFSSLEAMDKMTAQMEDLTGSQMLVQAATLIGKQVSAKLETGEVVTGTISQVKMISGQPTAVVNGRDRHLADHQIGYGVGWVSGLGRSPALKPDPHPRSLTAMMRSLFSAISGLKGHQTMMDVVGNNIANVNTTAFKSSRITFQDIISQTLRGAQAPDGHAGRPRTRSRSASACRPARWTRS